MALSLGRVVVPHLAPRGVDEAALPGVDSLSLDPVAGPLEQVQHFVFL
jgi:hypothetical protein